MQTLDAINAGYLDIKCYAGNIIGAPGGLQITLIDQNNSPIIPAGPLRMEVRFNSKSIPLLVFAVNDGLTQASNVITLFKQVDLAGGTYQYDLSNLNSDGSLTTYFYGKFIVTQNITNPRG